ncbi:unnamed protein product [Psylliodes chrysocephalus]|uniref:Phosphatidylinositol N-acetylglucosaminyltransferase subunit Q n=1 Tax=Psylliodes chrysocephalus TaxID=3402493 RepID=A0A9P0CW12_9CUCU|nr:unnamed protein product [Psylliodes chrysocephala]
MKVSEKTILVFIPDNLNYKRLGYLSGQKKVFPNSEVYYITSVIPTKTNYQSIGFIGEKVDFDCRKVNTDIPIYINSLHEQIVVRNNLENKPITQIIYDYERFKHSDLVNYEPEKYGKHLKYLSSDLRSSTQISTNGRNIIVKYLLSVIYLLNCFINLLFKLSQVVQISSTFVHFEESIKTLRWFLNTVLEEKKITPKLGNTILAKIIDLALGLFLISYVLDYEEQIFDFMNFIIESIISNLRGLLLYLMGQPIGLKLNYGFNNFLGRFFLYHISLWRIFLHGLYPLFTSHFKWFVLPGIFGVSYQIAMISDIVSIATFHSYCIYIYAARLFNLQLKCLKSLWRVSIGRKFNPLRSRVDSCQYSQNQLFIGTLSFTILLFLLPTTTMYYVVFTVLLLRGCACTTPGSIEVSGVLPEEIVSLLFG